MLHRSELGEHAGRFPTDQDGNVPEHGDHWGELNFEHGPNDPHENGISDEERARRMDYLNSEWWPKIIAQVNEEKNKLSRLPGGSPIRKWREQVIDAVEPRQPHGFEVEGID